MVLEAPPNDGPFVLLAPGPPAVKVNDPVLDAWFWSPPKTKELELPPGAELPEKLKSILAGPEPLAWDPKPPNEGAAAVDWVPPKEGAGAEG